MKKSDKLYLYDDRAEKAVKVCRVIIAVLLCCWALQPILYSVVVQFTYKTSFVNKFVYYGRLWYTYWANPALIILGMGVLLTLLLMVVFTIPTSSMKEPFDTKKFFRSSLKYFEFYLLGAVLLWSIVSLFFSPNFQISFFGFDYYKGGVLYYFFYAAMFCGVFALTDKQKKWVLNSFVIVSLFFAAVTALKDIEAVDNYLNYIYTEKNIWLLPTFQYSHCAIYSNSNFYGYFLSFAVILSGGLFFFERKKVLACIYLISFALNEYCLLLNDTLGSFIAVLFSIVFFSLAICISRRRFYIKIAVLFLTFIAVIGITEVFTDLNIFASIRSLFKDVKIISNPDGYSQEEIAEVGSARYVLWKAIFELILLSPIFGNGIDCYAQYGKNLQYWIDNINYKTGALIEYPHNEFLQLAYGAGIPALIFYFAALAFIYVKAVVQNKKLTNLQILGLSCAAGYIVSSLFGNGWSYMIPNYLIFLAKPNQLFVK